MFAQVYQRMRDYYGPQYDIQTGVYHQGYGDEDSYDSFWGKGSLYIDLPRSRVYDASFNCTPGFQARRDSAQTNRVMTCGFVLGAINHNDTLPYRFRHYGPGPQQGVSLRGSFSGVRFRDVHRHGTVCCAAPATCVFG